MNACCWGVGGTILLPCIVLCQRNNSVVLCCVVGTTVLRSCCFENKSASFSPHQSSDCIYARYQSINAASENMSWSADRSQTPPPVCGRVSKQLNSSTLILRPTGTQTSATLQQCSRTAQCNSQAAVQCNSPAVQWNSPAMQCNSPAAVLQCKRQLRRVLGLSGN